MDDASPGSAPAFVPRARAWPVVVVLVAIAAVVAFFVLRAMRAPAPLRVLVAVDMNGHWWEGSKPAAVLADRLAARLSKLGFEPVKAGDPEVTKVLENAKSPEEAARALHAAFVVTARIVPEVLEHPIESGKYHEARASTDVAVQHVARDKSTVGTVVGFGGAKEKDRALGLLADSMADQIFDVALPAIMSDPSIRELLEDRQSKVAISIYPARDFLEQRDGKVKGALSAYEKLRVERQKQEEGLPKPTYLSSPAAQDELVGVAASGVLVATNGIRPFFFAETRALGWYNELETLEWRVPGKPAEVLWKGYNIYGYPGAAPGGRPAVLVEDIFGWAKAITVVPAQGPSKRVLVDPDHRYIDPRVAPGGARVATWDRPCPTCAGSLLVLTLDGKKVFEAEPEGGRFEGMAWVDATHVAFVHAPLALPPEGAKLVTKIDPKDDMPVPALYVVDCAATPPSIEAVPLPLGESYGAPSASPNGEVIALERRDSAKSIALYRRATKTFEQRAVPGLARSPSWSPDGTRLAFELWTDDSSEIAVARVDGGDAQVLTKNPFRDRHPLFSSDGATVFYESVDQDPNWPDRRSLVFIASVPAPK